MAKATLISRTRSHLREDVFAEIVIWSVPSPLRGSVHHFKYRMALVASGECVLRYDNEAGKGDHRHVHSQEEAYLFESVETLLVDFRSDVEGWLDDNP